MAVRGQQWAIRSALLHQKAQVVINKYANIINYD